VAIKIIERSTLDPGGKKVDVYPDVGLVRTFVFDADEGDANKEDLLASTVNVLRKISEHGDKRVRERDLPVWFGKSRNSIGIDLVSIAIPEPTAIKAFNLFYDEFRQYTSYIECGAYLLRDTMGQPLTRYLNGKIHIYGDPFIAYEVLAADGYEDVEYRSWETASTAKCQSPYAKPEKPSRRLDSLYTDSTGLYYKRHSIDVWQENRQIILEFLHSLKAACGYKRLKDITENFFGIAVHEEMSSGFSKYGCIRLGWLDDNFLSASVRILINRNIDDKLKYTVLAHELSHYLNHFPFLLANQIVEETCWGIPEVQLWWNNLLTYEHQTLLKRVEDDAHESSTHFLLPPWMRPVSKLTSIMLENGKQPEPGEFVWRCLQPLFPDTDGEEFSWVNYSQMEEKARTELSALQGMAKEESGHSLYMTILDATIRVERRGYNGSEVIYECFAVLEKTYQFVSDIADINEQNIKEYISRQIGTDSSGTIDSLLGEYGGFGERFNKEILPPIEPNKNSTLFSSLPLRPASFNAQGDFDNDWQIVCLPNSPFGTVEEWRNFKPECGLILYRMESWQIDALKKI